jgi:hypothetical protein
VSVAAQYVSVRRQVLVCDATALTGMRSACMLTFCKGCALHARSAARWAHTGTHARVARRKPPARAVNLLRPLIGVTARRRWGTVRTRSVCRGALAPLPGAQPRRNGRIRLNPRWEGLWRDLNGLAAARMMAVIEKQGG